MHESNPIGAFRGVSEVTPYQLDIPFNARFTCIHDPVLAVSPVTSYIAMSKQLKLVFGATQSRPQASSRDGQQSTEPTSHLHQKDKDQVTVPVHENKLSSGAFHARLSGSA